MATYRVGVFLTASGGSFQRGMRAAAGATRQTRSALRQAAGSATAFGRQTDGAGRKAQSALRRASGSATAFGRQTDDAGRRAQSALRRASGSVRGVNDALRRTSGHARQAGGAVDQAAGRSNRRVRSLIQSFRELGRAIRETGRAPAAGGGGGIGGGAIARGVAALGGGFAVSRAAGQELALDDRFTRLAVDTRQNDEQALQTRRRIEAAAQATRVPVSELLGAVEEFVGRTGDFASAMANLDTTAQAIQRLGAAGSDLGAIGAQLRKGNIRSADDYRRAILMMVESEREGALRGRDLARTAAEALSLHFAIPGQQGLGALEDFLVLAQMGMVGTGDPHKSMTALRGVLTASQDPAKLEEMEKLGAYGAARRSPRKVLEELVAATGGDMTKLGRIFEVESRAIPAMFTTEEGRGVRDRVTEGVRNVDEDLFESEVQRLADQLSAKIQALGDRMQARFSRLLGGPIQDVAAAGFALEDYLLPGAAAVLGGRALYRGGRRGLDAWRRRRSPADAGGQGGGPPRGGGPAAGSRSRGGPGFPGTIGTLHVTTLIAGRTVGGGVLPGAGAGGRGRTAAQRAAGGGGLLRRAAGGAGNLVRRAAGALRRVPVLNLLLGGAGVAAAMAQGDRAGAARQAGGVAGGVGGAAAGGMLGGAIGSVVPVLGTAIGAGIGSFLGGWFGSDLGAAAAGSALERAAGRTGADDPTALERAAGMNAETRDSRRREARRRWQEGEASAEGRGEPPPLTPDQIGRSVQEVAAMRAGQVVNGGVGVDKSVRIDSPVFQVQGQAGDPAEMAEELFQQLMERIRRALRRDEERTLDITYSDPDPTLLF